jgi:hypothetical protein
MEDNKVFNQIYKIGRFVIFAITIISITKVSYGTQTFVFRATEAVLKADDGRPPGTCPLTVTFHGYVSANGPGVVRYVFSHSDGPGVLRDVGPHELVFRAAGRQPVTMTWTFNDLGGSSHYDGWAAIKILSPSPLESSHATGGFSLHCPLPLQAANSPQPVKTVPVGGSFQVSLNGFHVNRQTRDNPLDLDGPGDEIFIRDATFKIDAKGHSHNIAYSTTGARSSIYNVRTGDSFPARGAETGAGLPLTLGIPHSYYSGDIIHGEALVIFPALWEWDSDDEAPRNLGDAFLAMARDPHLVSFVSRFLSIPTGTDIRAFIKKGSVMGLPLTVTLGHGPLGLGEVGNRPIGMTRRDADTYQFDPTVVIITYEAADMISRNDFGHGLGIVPLRFVDDRDLEGDYTVFLQVKRIP